MTPEFIRSQGSCNPGSNGLVQYLMQPQPYRDHWRTSESVQGAIICSLGWCAQGFTWSDTDSETNTSTCATPVRLALMKCTTDLLYRDVPCVLFMVLHKMLILLQNGAFYHTHCNHPVISIWRCCLRWLRSWDEAFRHGAGWILTHVNNGYAPQLVPFVGHVPPLTGQVCITHSPH